MLKVAVLGLGERGRIYTKHLTNHKQAQVVAICDLNKNRLDTYKKKLNLSDNMVFDSDEKLFASGKLADAIVIATQDQDHFNHAMKAIENGYDVLIEKPLSPIYEHCVRLNEYAKEKGAKVIVCHVLRYAPYYDAIKNTIDSGAIGEVVAIQNTEYVAYWHYAHSYVRGNWHNEETSGPSILTKCCHDLDMMYYLTGKKCESVYSSGKSNVFHKDRAPKGATEFCLDGCPHVNDCAFSAPRLYYKFSTRALPKCRGYNNLVTGESKFSTKKIKEVLKTSDYGRCVYLTNHDVMEEQSVVLNLEDNIKINHRMTAFCRNCQRRIQIAGSKGEIIGIDHDSHFILNIFGERSKKIRINKSITVGHLGGDKGIIEDFVSYLLYGKDSGRLSVISETLQSHKVAFAAEKSRKTGEVIIVE